MNRAAVFLVCIFLLFLFIGCTARDGQTTQPEISQNLDTQTVTTTQTPTQSQYAAPDFVVYDYDGNPVKLSDFRGKPVVLNFWASWCGPCKSEMPDFNAVFLEMGQDIQFMMVNLTDGSGETKESAFSYVASQNFQFPVYYDLQYSASNAYGIYSIPTTFFIDAEGELVTYAQGAIPEDILRKGISMIID